VAHRGLKGAAYFSRVFRVTSRCAILAIFLLAYALPGLAQKVLTLNDISDLIKSGVGPNRIAQLVEKHGVGFEMDDRALRRLKQDGANETVLSAVKKMSARYAEGNQQIRRQQEEEARRRREEEAKRRAEEQKRQQAKATQEAARKVEESKSKAQEAAKQKPQRVTLLSREDVGRVASLRNVMSTEEGEVSGELVNHSKQTLREVRLQILYSWRWKNEHRPGQDDPGRATYYVLDKEIPPGQTVRFNYKPSPPLPAREDGQFDISVKVAGFAQVFPGGAAR
jgi:hypothetical protein